MRPARSVWDGSRSRRCTSAGVSKPPLLGPAVTGRRATRRRHRRESESGARFVLLAQVSADRRAPDQRAALSFIRRSSVPIAGWLDGATASRSAASRRSRCQHFDPYAQALAKLERVHDRDLADVKALVEAEARRAGAGARSLRRDRAESTASRRSIELLPGAQLRKPSHRDQAVNECHRRQ